MIKVNLPMAISNRTQMLRNPWFLSHLQPNPSNKCWNSLVISRFCKFVYGNCSITSHCFCRNNNFSSNNNKIEKICSCSNGFVNGAKKCRRSVCCARVSIGSGRLESRSSWKLNAADARVIEKNSNNNAHTPTGLVDIPVCCYQVILWVSDFTLENWLNLNYCIHLIFVGTRYSSLFFFLNVILG